MSTQDEIQTICMPLKGKYVDYRASIGYKREFKTHFFLLVLVKDTIITTLKRNRIYKKFQDFKISSYSIKKSSKRAIF